jgi:hypothetical protein
MTLQTLFIMLHGTDNPFRYQRSNDGIFFYLKLPQFLNLTTSILQQFLFVNLAIFMVKTNVVSRFSLVFLNRELREVIEIGTDGSGREDSNL